MSNATQTPAQNSEAPTPPSNVLHIKLTSSENEAGARDIQTKNERDEIKLAWGDIKKPLSVFNNGTSNILCWLGNKLSVISSHRLMTHGPLAPITLPLAIALRETGKALIETATEGSCEHPALPNVLGAMIGFGAGFATAVVTLPPNETGTALTVMASGTALGGLTGNILAPITVATIFTACKIIKNTPTILANSVTGMRRSYDFMCGKKPVAEPVIINPVPDCGMPPLVLPAPSALIKLAGAANNHFGNDADMAQDKPVANQPAPSTPPPAARLQ